MLSQGNLHVSLQHSITNTGQIMANGNATVETTATLTNQSTLTAGNTLNAKAATIDNQAGGTISANTVKLQATDSHTLTNRGLINGGETVLETQTLNNLGTGKIYGDHVAIAATTLTNAAENGTAPVIAARSRLDIGAHTIHNSNHAILFSDGDLAIGGSLDASHHATGQAAVLNNDSATIEATGSADIHAATINNTNQNFSTSTQTLPVQSITEYQGAGSPNRYTPGTPDVYIFNDESDHLHTPEGNYESWTAYNYTRTTTETRVASSDPGQILSGGAMRLTADTLNNDKSRIIAGGTLTGTIGTLNNTEVDGERITTDSGSATSYWRDRQKGRDSTGSSTSAYTPAAAIQAISLTPTVYQQNAAVSGSGTTIAALSTATVNQTPGAVGSTTGPTQGGQTITPITQVIAATSSNASGPATVVRSGGINTSVPNTSLFGITPSLTAHYLIETDPAFANYRTWLSSDYLLNALALNPATAQKRLGDGFYEQKLIREQVAQLTGRRFLDGYANDEAQYRALLDNALTFAQAQQLIPGIALSAAQMAQLTSDIVWLVEKTITLPDGTTTKALVPQLYVRVREGDLQSGGALLAANNIQLDLTGDLNNSGTIASRQVVALTADNIKNLGGRILGADVAVAARTDLDNLGGVIAADNNLIASAGRDLNVTTATRTQTNAQSSQTNLARVAGLYVTGGTGVLVASAGRNANLIAADIQNQGSGDTAITAANNLNLGTVVQGSSNRIVWDSKNTRSDASAVDIGTSIQTQGNLTLAAGNDLNARAANVISSQGNLLATAGNDVNLIAGQANVQVDEAHEHKGRSSAFAKKTITTRDTLDQTTAQATTFSGNTTTVLADRNIQVKGSNVVSDNGTTLVAKNNLEITAATNTTVENHFRQEKKTGLFSGGGFGVTIGTQQQSTDQKSVTTTAAASTVGSTQGNVDLQAGKNYTQTGSDVVALQGDINIRAQKVDITEARETSNNQIETQFKQSGLTVAITSPVISAIQTAQQMRKAASDTSDPRMKALAAANIAFAGKNAADAIKAGQGSMVDGNANAQVLTNARNEDGTLKTNPDGTAETRDANAADKVGGINLAISIGSSSSQSKTTQTSDSARGSNVTAGNNLTVVATGAGQDSDITVQGSTLQAGNRVALSAQDELKLLAAKNTADQHSTNKSKSGSVGISVGTDGLLFTASASGARGNADGSDVTWTDTQVNAGRQVTITSGSDTALKGAVVQAPQVTANIGGNLAIESLQDTSKFDSKQQSLGGSISVGYGKMSGSVSANKSRVDSDYASVTQQSGIRAGDGGFNVSVARNTDLTGGAITSTQQAIDDNKNQFTTGGELTTSDIQNRASYKASSVGVNVGTGMSLDGKLSPQGTGMGVGKDSGSAASTATATISGIAGNKEARTGDAETGIARIFDADKVQKDINAQVVITQTFGREASKAIGDYAAQQEKKASELRTQATAETDPDKRTALQAQADKLDADWGPNGSLRLAAHTVVGGLTGGAQGALGAAGGTVAAPTVAQALTEAGIDPELGKIITAAASTVMGAAVGGAAGAGAALNEVANNFLSHPEAAKREAAKQKQLQCKDDACRQQAQQEIDQWNRLDSWRDEQIRVACETPASAACQSWNAAVQYAKVTYKGYDPQTDPTGSIAGERREVNEQAFLYGQRADNPYLYGVGKGLLKLTPPALVAGVGVGTYALTTAILENGLVDTAINIAKGIKELPGEMQARLNSADPAVRGEALVDVLALGAGGAAVSAKLVQVGGDKFAKAIVKQRAAKAAEDAAEDAVRKAKIENNVNADNTGFANVAQREFKPGTTHRAENINAGQVTDRDGLVRVDEPNTLNNNQVAEQLGYTPERWSTQRPAWKEGTLVTDRVTTQPETYRMVIDGKQLKNIQANLDNGNLTDASKNLGLWATKSEVNSVADVRNSLAIPKEWKGRNGEKLYVIEFTVKPGAGVREGTVGPMFDTINKVELPGNGHQVNFMKNNPKDRPDLYRINLGSAKELK